MPPNPVQRTGRAEPREITALQELKAQQPDLASAADLQIALLRLQWRVQARVPHPALDFKPDWLRAHLAAGRPVLRFEEIPLNWTDLRLMLRETAALLYRHETLEEPQYRRAEALAREAHALQPLVSRWYNATAAPDRLADDVPRAGASGPDDDGMDHVLLLAMRPFLARCADVLMSQADFKDWQRGGCPVCGGEPEFAVITPAAERLLICGRCTGRWPYDPLACPFCGNSDRSRITSFASRDGLYRIYACDMCRRYLKAYDARRAPRPVMVPVDSVATLPLDAAAMQKGYTG